MSLKGAFILDCVRTPRARVKSGASALSTVHAQELLGQTLSALVKKTGVDAGKIEDIIIGCVSQVGEQGANIARNAALTAGLPISVGGVTLNRCCASGLQAINFAAAEVASGMSDLHVAGGVESMSRVKMASDGGGLDGNNPLLRAKYLQITQGISADLIATMENFSRQELDQFALRSQQKAGQAQSEGRFDRSIVTIKDPNTGAELLKADNYLRPESTLESLNSLEPAFTKLGGTALSGEGMPDDLTIDQAILKFFPQLQKIDHRHTAAAASGIVDGAAAVMICSQNFLSQNNLKARGRILSTAVGGSDPVSMMTGQADIVHKALKLASMTLADIDLFEINEAFAAIPLLVMRRLGISDEKVNVNGGSIALGHPLGATGAILLGTALDELERRDLNVALITLCAAGGQSIATIIQRE